MLADDCDRLPRQSARHLAWIAAHGAPEAVALVAAFGKGLPEDLRARAGALITFGRAR